MDPVGCYCAECGTENPLEAAFCEQCGARLQKPGNGEDTPVQVAPCVGELFVVSGPGGLRGTRLGLTGGRQYIGRSQSADIVLDDPAVSTEHALIWYEYGFFHIQDQASHNGTFVADSRIVRDTLRDGDEIRVGDTYMVLRVTPVARRHIPSL